MRFEFAFDSKICPFGLLLDRHFKEVIFMFLGWGLKIDYSKPTEGES